MPLVGAIAGGNTILLKLSRHAPTVADTLKGFLDKYLDNDVIKVEAKGGAEMITKILEVQWDHIFFTGKKKLQFQIFWKRTI